MLPAAVIDPRIYNDGFIVVLHTIEAIPQVPVTVVGRAIAIAPRIIPPTERPKAIFLRRVKASAAPIPNSGIATPISAVAVPWHFGDVMALAIFICISVVAGGCVDIDICISPAIVVVVD